jgi:hypothetical protein
MKKMRKIFAAVGAATILVLAACIQPSGAEGSNPLADKGFININLDIGGGASVRTLLLGSESYAAFSFYSLSFTRYGSGDTVNFDDLTSLYGIVLDAGAYRLSFTAWTGSGDAKAKAATGTVDPVTVVEAQTINVEISLTFTTVSGGSDTLTGTLTDSSGLARTGARLAWTPLSGGTTAGSEYLDVTALSLNKSLDAGYYLITVTLSTEGLEARKSDIVYISDGQTPVLNWGFLRADFSSIVTSIWLLGVHTDWTVYNDANKLDEQQNGTFTWKGEMSQSYFRFSLNDTSTWDSDRDRPRRFEPASDGTVISFGTATNMMDVVKHEGTPVAWNLGGPGYYEFIVNPYAKTLIVTKPVMVESVVIKKEGGEVVSTIFLAQGTTNYQFTAEVNGKNMAGVTWTISSGVTSGTAIGQDGKLTIAEAETVAGTFTITATSVGNASKSASVTVTVINKDAGALPAPTNVALSSQGVASWDALADETGVASYSIQIWKGATPENTRQGDRITVIKDTGKTGNVYSYDLLSVLRGLTPTHYGISVKAVTNGGKADSEDTDNTALAAWQQVTKKVQPPYIWWASDNTAVAHWDTVSGAGNATDYTVNVYRGERQVATTTGTVTYTDANDGKLKAYADLTYTIAASGAGSYTFGVITKGDGYLILDSDEKKDANKVYVSNTITLPAPINLRWSGNTAEWDAVTGATGYEVQLYKDGSVSGSAVSATGTSYTGFDVSAAGFYTFKVKAKGDGTNSEDSVAADSSATANGELSVGTKASITLTPLEGWSGTLGVNGGGSASMAKNGGSLTIAVTGGSFTTFVWIVDGDVVSGQTGSSISLSGSDYELGNHSVTVYALDTKNAPWSPKAPIAFTVTAN